MDSRGTRRGQRPTADQIHIPTSHHYSHSLPTYPSPSTAETRSLSPPAETPLTPLTPGSPGSEVLDALLDLSNAVRLSIWENENFGSNGQRLSRFLNETTNDEQEKRPAMSLDSIRYARLDKLLEEICELGPRLRGRRVRLGMDMLFRMDEKYANQLQHAWRSRFKELYWYIDDDRMKRLRNTLLRDMWFAWSQADGEGHWQTRSSTLLSDLESRLQFEPGHWWLNTACAERDGMVAAGRQETPMEGPYGIKTMPLLVGEEIAVGDAVTKYIRVGRMAPGTFPKLADTGKTVPILRGSGLHSVDAPKAGVRYDGLYILKETGLKLFPGESDIWRVVLTLERVANQAPMKELRCIPTPSQLDDWQLHEKIEGEVVKRLGQTEHTAWVIRRQDLQSQKVAGDIFRETKEYVDTRVRKKEAQRPNPLPLPPPPPPPPCRRRGRQEEADKGDEGEAEDKEEGEPPSQREKRERIFEHASGDRKGKGVDTGEGVDKGKGPVKSKEEEEGKQSAKSQRADKGKGLDEGKGIARYT